MYRVYWDSFLLHDLLVPSEEHYYLENPTLTEEVNKVAEFTFDIYPNHPAFDKLEKLVPNIILEKDNKILFKGRIIKEKQNMNNSKQVTCESVLAFLLDSIQRPFEFQGTPTELFTLLINNHNEQVEEYKRFKIGKTTGSNLDNNEYINRSSESYLSTWEAIETRLLNIGGYLLVRYEDDGNYIDWVDDFGENGAMYVSDQKIEFGENLIDLLVENDASETYSVVIPLGVEFEETKDEAGNVTPKHRLTIESENNGKDYLVNQEALEKYGWIVAPIEQTTWDDVTVVSNLLRKGAEFLNSQAIMLKSTLELNAIDLSLVNNYISTKKSFVTMKGKNLFNVLSEKTGSANINNMTFGNGSIKATLTDDWGGSYVKFGDVFEPGEYIFSLKGKANGNIITNPVRIGFNKQVKVQQTTLTYNNYYKYYFMDVPTINAKITATEPFSILIAMSYYGSKKDDVLEFTEIMLEKGLTQTEYEPYWEKQVETFTEEKVTDSFGIGEYIEVSSTPHNLSKKYLLTKKVTPITKPENMTITLGETEKTFTGLEFKDKNDVEKDVIQKVESTLKDYVTNDKVTTIVDERIEDSSVIKQMPDEILLEVSKTYATTEYVEGRIDSTQDIIIETQQELLSTIDQTSTNIRSEVSEKYYTKTDTDTLLTEQKTALEQTKDSFEMTFEGINSDLKDLNDQTNAKFEEYKKYIRFEDGKILLGEVGNQLELTISNDRISFLQSGIEVAYLSNGKLYVTDGEFIRSLRVGKFAFIPRANGSLDFKKVGG